ncbi:hypothetical protein PYCC9005_001520 [Savitreella phatthalungensis]
MTVDASPAGSLDGISLETLLPKHLPGSRLPTFSFAHGSPALMSEVAAWVARSPMAASKDFTGGHGGPAFKFLQRFGPYLLRTYRPKAIVLFSAHWENASQRGPLQVEIARNSANYQRDNLLYDYYGFPDAAYKVKCATLPDSTISDRVLTLLNTAGISATAVTDQRALDHGCFVPLRIMFGGDDLTGYYNPSTGLPTASDPSTTADEAVRMPAIVEVSQGRTAEENLAIGRALTSLRDEGVLILSGGLSIHTFRNWTEWSPSQASQSVVEFESLVKLALTTPHNHDVFVNKVLGHPGYRKAHDSDEHFIPLYVAAGASTDDRGVVISDVHGAVTAAFF